MSEGVETAPATPAELGQESVLALAQWWAKEARVWMSLGNEERAGHAAGTAYHFARRLEKLYN